MPSTSRLGFLYLAYLAKPATNRLIYRTIRRQRVRKVLELGIGIGQRAMRMIEVAARLSPLDQIEFTGIDLFESRSATDGPGVTLKMAHRLLGATGTQIRLVPGDPFSGLSRAANFLGQIDLMILSPRLDPRQLARAWFYVPRLLHGRSQVFWEKLLPGGRTSSRLVPHGEIDALAAAASPRRAA